MVETHEVVRASLLRHHPWCEGSSVCAVRSSPSSTRNPQRIRGEYFGDAPIGINKLPATSFGGLMVKWSTYNIPGFEDWQYYEEEIDELERKVTKLRRKLADERFKVKAAVACVIFTLVITLGVSVFAMLNFEGMKKSV
ncbi:type VI secretion system baseplate subunit TssE [Sesbania bispinosa]|nr:type VI secretion system baseplate subunit TssE [Sesbania bispinosa]